MPPRRQKPSSAKIEVSDANGMLIQTFRLHCQTRHPQLRFRSRGEHDADHRLHGDSLDHVHKLPGEVNPDVDHSPDDDPAKD